MDQYSKTPLYLQNLKVTKGATNVFIKGVPNYIIHGELKEREFDHCPFCHCRRIHLNGRRTTRLKHLSIGKSLVQVEVSYRRWECQGCRRSFRNRIPFKARHHRITSVFAKQIEHFLTIGQTAMQCSRELHYNRTTIQDIDKRRIRRLAKDMRPTHQSRFLCVDEFLLHRGHEYATVVIDYETGESLFCTQGKTYGQMIEFFRFVGYDFMDKVVAVSMDMNASYAKAFKDICPHIRIVYDGFHIIKNYNDMVLTEIRRAEQRRLQDEFEQARRDGDTALCEELRQEYMTFKNSRYLILSNRKTLEMKDSLASEHNSALFDRYVRRGLKLPIGKHYWPVRSCERLKAVLQSNEKLQVSYELGEMLKHSLSCRDPVVFKTDLKRWVGIARATGYPELEKFSNLIEKHFVGICNRTLYPLSNGPIEGTNLLIKNIRRQSYGIRDDDYFFLRIWEGTRKHPKCRPVPLPSHHFSA